MNEKIKGNNELLKFSVIIPVYNAEKYLRKCFDSVLNQTYQNWEIFAVDDVSLDNSYKILKEYANNDIRIHIYRNKENEGAGLTRNRALDQATGDYIVFIDSDDYIEPDYFQLLYEKIFKSRADVVFIDVMQEDPDGTLLKLEKMSKFKDLSRNHLIGSQMTGYMPWGAYRKAVSKKLIEENHLRFSKDTVGEEAIYSFELLRKATKIDFIEKLLYHYINHPNSLSKNPDGTWEITLQKLKYYLEQKGIRTDYDSSLNSFAFVALIGWLLKYAKRTSVQQCRLVFKEKIQSFEKEYGWKINPGYLRKDVRILIPFVKHKFILPLVVGAKIIRR